MDPRAPVLSVPMFPCSQSAHISFKHMRERPQAGLARLMRVAWRPWERVVSPNSSGSQTSREASDWPDLAQPRLNKSRRADRWCALIGQAWSRGQSARSALPEPRGRGGGPVSQVGVLGELHSYSSLSRDYRVYLGGGCCKESGRLYTEASSNSAVTDDYHHSCCY